MANARKVKRQLKALETKEDTRVDQLIDILRSWATQMDADTGIADTNYNEILENLKKTDGS